MKSGRGLLTAAAVIIVMLGSFLLITDVSPDRSSAAAWQPTSAQTALAQKVALDEANSLNPDATAIATTDRWPANVTSVTFAASTRNSAITLTGASGAPDDRNVLVIQMTGTFQILAISVPPGVNPVMIRNVITLVVDANTGDVIDYSAADSAPKLANSIPLIA